MRIGRWQAALVAGVVVGTFAAAAIAAPSAVVVRASIGGVVIETVAAGTAVQEGTPLIFVQTATKPREVAARANRDGIVSEVLIRVGDRVSPGDMVARIGPR